MTDPSTVLTLAKLASNSYQKKDNFVWFDVITNGKYKVESEFGWNETGLRGYVYADSESDIILLSFKGTSKSILGYEEGTSLNDQLNDNKMFSCCCGGGVFSKPVCECAFSNNRCGMQCLKKDIRTDRSSYFNQARQIYSHVKRLYPKSSIWVLGHSLGGAIASLIGVAYNIPAIAFNAPGERQYAQRLGLVPLQMLNFTEYLINLPVYHISMFNYALMFRQRT